MTVEKIPNPESVALQQDALPTAGRGLACMHAVISSLQCSRLGIFAIMIKRIESI